MFSHLHPPDVLEQIASIAVSQQSVPKTCFWNLTTKGDFNVKSFYHAWESKYWNEPSKVWGRLWKLPVAQGILTFIWLLLKDKLLMNKERKKRKMTYEKDCSFCDADEEDIDHVLQKCPLAKTIWTNLLPRDLHRAFFENSSQSG